MSGDFDLFIVIIAISLVGIFKWRLLYFKHKKKRLGDNQASLTINLQLFKLKS
jgi:hypothetical protein